MLKTCGLKKLGQEKRERLIMMQSRRRSSTDEELGSVFVGKQKASGLETSFPYQDPGPFTARRR